MSRTPLAALVVVACLLAACSDDDPKPDIADPTPSVTSSSAPVSTSPTESATPALGPEETVRAWVEARNAALQDGDTSEVRALSQPDCTTCDQHITPIEDVYSSGGSFDTSGWKIDRLKVVDTSTTMVKVNVAMTMAGGRTTQQAGATPVSYAEDHRLMFFRLTKSEAGWLVNFVGYYS